MLHVVEPGKKAFPFHAHHVTQELFVILEGEGTYRFGDESYPVKAGDVCAAPTGGPEVAHQIVNTGKTALKYLGISANPTGIGDVVEYPDSRSSPSPRASTGRPARAACAISAAPRIRSITGTARVDPRARHGVAQRGRRATSSPLGCRSIAPSTWRRRRSSAYVAPRLRGATASVALRRAKLKCNA